MIIGLVTLMITLFFGGSVDVFYIDKIEQGINKNIDNKERKKELEGSLDLYKKQIKQFNKNRKERLKNLKEKNEFRTTSAEWYEDFFGLTLQERQDLQEVFITERLRLQDLIKPDEWDKIMSTSSDVAAKLEEKELKKAKKENDKNLFSGLEEAIVEAFPKEEKQSILMKSLKEFEENYFLISISYDNINVNENKVLADRNATREQLQNINVQLNTERKNAYDAYMKFIADLKSVANDKQWSTVIKQLNKLM